MDNKNSMGTRAIIEIEKFLKIYIQHDGHPRGAIFQTLKQILKRNFVNGYYDPYNQINGFESFVNLFILELNKYFNRIECVKNNKNNNIKFKTGTVYFIPYDPKIHPKIVDYYYRIKPIENDTRPESFKDIVIEIYKSNLDYENKDFYFEKIFNDNIEKFLETFNQDS